MSKKKKDIVKSNALIEASYRLTPAEQGIILACIAQIGMKDEVTDKTMYKVSVQEYMTLTGVNRGTAYRDIKAAALRLKSRDVRIPYLPNLKGKIKRDEGVLITGWVQSIIYSDKSSEVRLRFSHDMLPYISKITRCFTKYKLENVAKITSSYGIRLYELLLQHLNIKKPRTFSIEEFCETFMVHGKYSRIYDLKKRVIDPAVNDINRHTDLWAKWEQIKTGRKVTHLKFYFGLKKDLVKKSQPKLSSQKILGIDKTIIEKKAKAGETYNQAALRIKKEKQKESA